ncbi:hypothetical protein [Streptomyces sp. NPDC002580]
MERPVADKADAHAKNVMARPEAHLAAVVLLVVPLSQPAVVETPRRPRS